MTFPILVFCDMFAFKNRSKVMLSIEDYEDNTIDPNDFLDYIGWKLWVFEEGIDEGFELAGTNNITKVRNSDKCPKTAVN